MEHFDVLIVGAGLSGIDAAHHLRKLCPDRTYVILEQRERIGGTWDLFRYPGIRSDSDMFTMGYSFRPWTKPKAISPGEDIREYIAATAREEGIDRQHPLPPRGRARRVVFGDREVDGRRLAPRRPTAADEPFALTCEFLLCCAGYYRYSAGLHAGVPRHRTFSRARGAPAGVARGPRLRGKARRRRRLGRDGGDARARHGEDRRRT